MGNSFGKRFTITSFGESHGRCVGVIIDGCPAGLAITEQEIQTEVDRRRPGDGPVSTPRAEADRVVSPTVPAVVRSPNSSTGKSSRVGDWPAP